MLKIVENHTEEYLDFLKDLISFKSYPGQEKEIAEYLLAALEKLPIDEAFIDECGNVTGILRGDGTGPNIMLNGHMDVVPEGNVEKWAPFDPFKGEIVDGKLYGRGIVDMKGGLGAMFYAFKAFAEYVQQTGKKLSGDIIFSGVVQEEPATMFGMEYFMQETAPKHAINPALVYISEPTLGTVIPGQRGKIELVIKTYGKCAHSSAPEEGINALEHMTAILDAIFKKDGIFLDTDKAGQTCITVTNIIVKPGGTLSCIPDECEIAVDRRYTPKQNEEELLAEFEEIFARLKAEKYPDLNATVEPRYFDDTSWTGLKKKVKKWHPSWEVEDGHPYIKATFSALEKAGLPTMQYYFAGGTDGSMTCGVYGIPTICYSDVYAYSAHKEPEMTPVEGLLKTYMGYVAILAEHYGVDLAEFDK